MTTTGIESFKGAIPKAIAMESAPKDTWDSPSPIMENFFSTRLTPSRAAQREIKIPTIKARIIKGYDTISLNSSMDSTSIHFMEMFRTAVI